MLSDAAAPQSLRGQWRGSYAIYSPNGATDPADCEYTITVRPERGGCCHNGGWDYGHWGYGDHNSRWALTAATDDGTGRIVAVSTDDDDPFTPPDPDAALVLTWLFPLEEIRRLEPGSYECSIIARLGSDTAELSSFTVVFR